MAALRRFKADYGHVVVRKTYDNRAVDGFSLGRWVRGLQQLYKENKLSQDKIRQLEPLGFLWQLMVQNKVHNNPSMPRKRVRQKRTKPVAATDSPKTETEATVDHNNNTDNTNHAQQQQQVATKNEEIAPPPTTGHSGTILRIPCPFLIAWRRFGPIASNTGIFYVPRSYDGHEFGPNAGKKKIGF